MTRKSAAERRQDLVHAGLRVIARDGMHAATVRAIVAEAGVPLATFHYVFDSRDEMIGEAYAWIIVPDPLRSQTRVPTSTTLLGAITESLHDWVDRFVEHPEYELAIMEIMAYCRRSPALAHLPGTVQARYVELVSQLVSSAADRIGVTLERSVEEVATIILHVTDGLTYHLLRTGDEAAARRFIDEAAPMLVAAIQRPGSGGIAG